MPLVERITPPESDEGARLEAIVARRAGDELPHTFGEAIARFWTHRFHSEVALLERHVEEIWRDVVLQHDLCDPLTVAVLPCTLDGIPQAPRLLPALDVASHLIDELRRHVDLRLSEAAGHPIDDLNLLRRLVAVDAELVDEIPVPLLELITLRPVGLPLRRSELELGDLDLQGLPRVEQLRRRGHLPRYPFLQEVGVAAGANDQKRKHGQRQHVAPGLLSLHLCEHHPQRGRVLAHILRRALSHVALDDKALGWNVRRRQADVVGDALRCEDEGRALVAQANLQSPPHGDGGVDQFAGHDRSVRALEVA